MTNMIKEAKRLHALGFSIWWLHPKSKRPIGNDWTTLPNKSWDQLNREYREGMNVGVRLGTPSKMPDGFLAGIDCDVKSKEKKHLVEMRRALAKLVGDKELPRVASGRGGGSAHLYCRTRKAFKTFTPYRSEELVEYQSPSKTPSKKERAILGDAKIKAGLRLGPAWEISLYSDGRQCVLPPSTHPDSGRAYRWEQNVHSAQDLPLLKIDLPSETPTEKMPKPTDKYSEKFSFKAETVDVSWLPISEEMRNGIISGDGVDDRSEFLLRATSALHSINLSKDQIISVLTDPANYISSTCYEHAQTKKRDRAAYWLWKFTVKKVLLERPGQTAFSDGPKAPPKKLSKAEQAEQDAEMRKLTKWSDQLERSRAGYVQSSLWNVQHIFLNAFGKKAKLFTKDLFANRVMYALDTPWGRSKGQMLEDIDLVLIKHWLAETWGFEPATNILLEAVLFVAHQFGFHPVKRWLKKLEWDGVPRIGTWLRDYCEASAPEPYLSDISRKFLVAMVKRVFEPGCQWDFILILEGRQGVFKSTLARTLAGDKWFMDNLPDLKDKDAVLYLQGKWLIELAELANIKRSDYSSVKAFFTRRIDTIRAPYGKTKEDVPRQCAFIGTVNEGQYLKDPTGNRRYMPTKVGLCDVKGIREVREQLFAEAYHVYKAGGEQLYLAGESVTQAMAAQEERQVDDENSEMKDALLEFLKSKDGEEIQSRRFKMRELFEGVSAPWGRFDGKYFCHQTGAGILAKMGFEKVSVNGQRYWRTPKGMYLNGSSELTQKSPTKSSIGSSTQENGDFY